MTRRPADQHAWGRRLRRWSEAEARARTWKARRKPVEVWRSRDFLVQLYVDGEWTRISVNRTHMPNGQDYADGITWDDLQRLKAEIGRGDQWAVEVFPADAEVVNDANMRHLWLLAEPPPFAWVAEPPEVLDGAVA